MIVTPVGRLRLLLVLVIDFALTLLRQERKLKLRWAKKQNVSHLVNRGLLLKIGLVDTQKALI